MDTPRQFNPYIQPNSFIKRFLALETHKDAVSETRTPELSSSPTSTAPSSPYSRSTLSLDDPEIRKIWEDPRFGPVVHTGTPFDHNANTLAASPINLEQYTLINAPPLDNDRSCGAPLDPFAQPFVPSSVRNENSNAINMDQTLLFYDGHGVLTPLSWTVEEGSPHPSLHYPLQSYYVVQGAFEPSYPPGLPHPPQNSRTLRPHSVDSVSEASETPLSYFSSLVEALHDPLKGVAGLETIFPQIRQWDLFTIRELASTLMMAAFGNEQDLVLPCPHKASCDRGVEITEIKESVNLPRPEVFHRVVASIAQLYSRHWGQTFVDTFLVQVADCIFRRFTFCFDPSAPESLNMYSRTHQTPPCLLYIRSALSLCETIGYLYQQNIVQRIDVRGCITLLLQDLMSVEHLEALRYIVLGSGLKLWDPSLSMLTAPGEVEKIVPVSAFALPPVRLQAKAKLCSDITLFCSKLDGYKIRRARIGLSSLRGDAKLTGESHRAKINEVQDVVRGWERELLKLIDQKADTIVF